MGEPPGGDDQCVVTNQERSSEGVDGVADAREQGVQLLRREGPMVAVRRELIEPLLSRVPLLPPVVPTLGLLKRPTRLERGRRAGGAVSFAPSQGDRVIGVESA